jgi:hypothetical protein
MWTFMRGMKLMYCTAFSILINTEGLPDNKADIASPPAEYPAAFDASS